MVDTKINPYLSPTHSPNDEPRGYALRETWVERPLAVRTLVVALLAVLGAWAAVGAMMFGEVWYRWIRATGPSSYRLDQLLTSLAVILIVLGVMASIATLVYGRWIHRLAIAFVLIPYYPLVWSLLDWLLINLAKSY